MDDEIYIYLFVAKFHMIPSKSSIAFGKMEISLLDTNYLIMKISSEV